MKRSALLFISISIVSLIASAQESLKSMRSGVTEKIDGKEYYIHTVKKGQTLYMISKAYGVDVNDVIRENPEVKEGLKSDQKLRIPSNKPAEPVQKKIPKTIVQEPKVPVPEPPPPEPAVEIPCGQDTSALKRIYNVALMMPLYLGEIDKMDTLKPPADAASVYRPLQFIQFYEGFLIALDSLKKMGLSVNLYMYDVNKDTLSTRRILKNPEMKKMDLIIGLLFHRNFQIVAAFAQKNNIPIVNPLSEREQILTGNTSVFKVYPSQETRITELADFLFKEYPSENILILRDFQYKEVDEPETLRKICAERNMNVHSMAGYGSAFESLSREKQNIIVVFSENKVFSIELVTKLSEFRNEYKLMLFGMPRWDKIEGLEPEYLVNLNTHVMAPSFIDYEEAETIKFVSQFQGRFKTDPELLAFQGFDIAVYFLSAMKLYGKAIDHCIPDFRIKSLQSEFQFIQTKGNGFENRHWEIFNYGNYKLNRVKISDP